MIQAIYVLFDPDISCILHIGIRLPPACVAFLLIMVGCSSSLFSRTCSCWMFCRFVDCHAVLLLWIMQIMSDCYIFADNKLSYYSEICDLSQVRLVSLVFQFEIGKALADREAAKPQLLNNGLDTQPSQQSPKTDVLENFFVKNRTYLLPSYVFRVGLALFSWIHCFHVWNGCHWRMDLHVSSAQMFSIYCDIRLLWRTIVCLVVVCRARFRLCRSFRSVKSRLMYFSACLSISVVPCRCDEAPNFMLFIVAGLVVISAILSPGLFFAWRLKNFGNDGLGLKASYFRPIKYWEAFCSCIYITCICCFASALFLPADITHARPCVVDAPYWIDRF